MKKRISIMKKVSRVFATFLMVPAIAFFAVSCSDDDDDNGSGGGNGGKDINEIIDLSTDPVSLTADNTTNTKTFTFTAQTAWEAAYADEASEWFTFSPDKGAAGDMTITVSAPYNEGAAKEGKIVIKHGTKKYEVTIKQVTGQPDLAQWNKNDILLLEFAPDPYNATENMPSTTTFKITTKQDYTAPEEAPFKIIAFEADENFKPTTTLAEWVKFNIAEEPSVANEGKVWEATVDTIAINWEAPLTGDDRIAYICIVPQETEVEDMFTNGIMKEEYLAMGTSLLQKYYSVNMDIAPEEAMIMNMDMSMMGGIPELKPWEAEYTANCKIKAIYTPQASNQGPTDWLEITFQDGKATLHYLKTLEELRTTSQLMHAMQVEFIIDRGELTPITTPTAPYIGFPLQISYVHY